MTQPDSAPASRGAAAASTLAALNGGLRQVADDLPLVREDELALLECTIQEMTRNIHGMYSRLAWVRWRTDHGRPAESARGA